MFGNFPKTAYIYRYSSNTYDTDFFRAVNSPPKKDPYRVNTVFGRKGRKSMSNYNTDYFNDCVGKANYKSSEEAAIGCMLASIVKSLSDIADVMETEAKIEYEDDDDEDSDD